MDACVHLAYNLYLLKNNIYQLLVADYNLQYTSYEAGSEDSPLRYVPSDDSAYDSVAA